MEQDNKKDNNIIHQGYSPLQLSLGLGLLTPFMIFAYIIAFTNIKLPEFYGIEGNLFFPIAVSTLICYILSLYMAYKFKITHDKVEILFFTRIFNRRKVYNNIKVDKISMNYIGDGSGINFIFIFEGKNKNVECSIPWNSDKLKKKWEDMGLNVVEGKHFLR